MTAAAPDWRRPALIAFVLTLLLQLPFHGGWLADPLHAILGNPFHGGHVWAADVVGSALWSGQWPDPTQQAGFPDFRRARFVAWAVLLPAGLMAPVVPPGLTVSLLTWMGPAFGAASMVLLARSLSMTSSSTGLIAAGVVYGLSPVTLGAALSGQVENSQSWVLPLLLWALWRSLARPKAAWLVPPLWFIGAGTSPYLAMLAAFLLPWLWVLRLGGRPPPVRALHSLPALIGAGGALLLVRAWLSPGDFDPAQDLFKPAYTEADWPPLFSNPLPVADLDTLLGGVTSPQPLAMVVHQPYLGLVAVAAVLICGVARRRWLFPLGLGLVLALGPTLAWDQAALELGGHTLALPARAARWLDLPLAHGGQYYRCILLAHLGLAGMLAAARRPRWLLGLGLLFALDVGRSLAMVGLPWPSFSLPTAAWSAWAEDPEPGAVVHLPMFSPYSTACHPVRLAGRAWHGRAVSDMPRADRTPPNHPLLIQLEGCTRRGEACPVPSLAELHGLGIRYIALDLPPGVPERKTLHRRLRKEWGNEDGEQEDLIWWTLPD